MADSPEPVSPETIAENANGAAEFNGDGVAVKAVPIPDQIAADKYAKAGAGVAGSNSAGGPKSGWRGVRMGRAIPPGAV